MIPLPLKQTQALEKACFLVNYSPKPGAKQELRAQSQNKVRWSAQSYDVSPSASSGWMHSLLYGVWRHAHPLCQNIMGSMVGKPLIGWGFMHQNGAVSDFEGGVRLTSSDGWDHFEPFWFLIPSRLEGKWGTVDWEAGGLADARHSPPGR